MTEGERQPSVREWIGAGCIALLFFYLRFPLLHGDALLFGWNSDAGVFGLAGRRIHDGVNFPIFFWAQSYMGLLTSYISAAVGFVVGDPGPLALRLAASIEVLAGIILYWLGLRRAFDRATALIVAAWLAAGPWFLFHFTVAPVGAEQAFFVGAILFWFVTRYELTTILQWFVFGLLCGFMWWINQSAVFVPAAAVLVAIGRSEWWARAKPRIRPVDRLLLRGRPVFVRITGLLLAFLLLLGILRAATLPVPALFLFHPIAEPLFVLLMFHAVLFGREWLEIVPRRWFFAALGVFSIGFLIAYAPVIIGGIRGAYPRTYGLSVPATALERIPWRIWTMASSDYPMFVGGWIVAVTLLVLILCGGPRANGRIAGVTLLLTGMFFVFSARAHPGTVRYGVVALPVLYAFAARAGSRFKFASLLNLVVFVALVFGRIGDVREIASVQREDYAGLGGNFDPRPTLAAIERAHYTVCDSDYWIAYKLQWLSDDRVRFIVSHGYNRTRSEVRGLVSQCHVDALGNVTAR